VERGESLGCREYWKEGCLFVVVEVFQGDDETRLDSWEGQGIDPRKLSKTFLSFRTQKLGAMN